MATYSVDVSNNNSTKTTVVHSGHLFPKPSHNTTVLNCCVVTQFAEKVAAVYHGIIHCVGEKIFLMLSFLTDRVHLVSICSLISFPLH